MGEMTSGAMRNYGTDALGSVVETVLNGVEENTYQYKPYGAMLAKTGVAADPSFLWNGGSGYRASIPAYSDYYVRHRVYSTTAGRWTSFDPYWPDELPYAYINGNPALVSDPSGFGGSGSGVGGGSSSGGGEITGILQPECCCKVEPKPSQAVSNVSTSSSGITQIDSQFSWVVRKRRSGESSGGCTWLWEEKSNRDFYRTGVTNQYFDVSPYAPDIFFGCSSKLQSAFGACATDQSGSCKDQDKPSYACPHVPHKRCLCIRLTINSGCDGKKYTFLVKQLVNCTSATLSTFVIYPPGSNPELDSYCSTDSGGQCKQ